MFTNYPFIIKGYNSNSGTASWQGGTGQGMWEGAPSFHLWAPFSSNLHVLTNSEALPILLGFYVADEALGCWGVINLQLLSPPEVEGGQKVGPPARSSLLRGFPKVNSFTKTPVWLKTAYLYE